MGKVFLELAQKPSCVAPALHDAGGSTPFGVTSGKPSRKITRGAGLAGAVLMLSSLQIDWTGLWVGGKEYVWFFPNALSPKPPAP